MPRTAHEAEEHLGGGGMCGGEPREAGTGRGLGGERWIGRDGSRWVEASAVEKRYVEEIDGWASVGLPLSIITRLVLYTPRRPLRLPELNHTISFKTKADMVSCTKIEKKQLMRWQGS